MPDPTAESWRRQVRRRLAHLDLPAAREAEIVDELVQMLRDAGDPDSHHPRSVERMLEDDPTAWRLLAAELAGGERRAQRHAGHHTRSGWMNGWRNDFVFGLRAWRKNPGLTAVAVVTLALGIGLNAAVFSLVDHVMLKPLAVDSESQLMRVYSQEPNDFVAHAAMAYPDFHDFREHLAAGDSFVGAAGFAMMFVALESPDTVELTIGESVSGDYFRLLGVQPALGRLLEEADDLRQDPQSTVVLSYRAWQRRFGGDPTIVGRPLLVNGQPLTVVGVAAKGFRGLTRGFEPEVWFPIAISAALGAGPTVNFSADNPGVEDRRDDRRHRWLWMVARRAAATPPSRAQAELAAFGERLAASYPESNRDRALISVPLRRVKILPGSVDNGITAASTVLMAVVGLVLLIACANLANLFLARALGRRKEIATRLALGASRARIVRQLLIESALVAALGAIASLAVVAASNALLGRFRFPNAIPITVEPALDLRVVLFTLAVGMATALVFGLTPALEAWRTDLNTALRDDRGRGGNRRRRRLQGALVVAQVTFSLLLLVFAGLSLRSVHNTLRADPGFVAAGAVAATLMPDLQGYDEGRVVDFYRRLREELEATPGVVSVSLPSHLPLSLWINTNNLAAGDRELPAENEWPAIDTAAVDGDYFATMGIPLVAGRTFSDADRAAERRLMIVNQALVERFWPGQEAIAALGKPLRTGRESPPYEVVGVVRDGKYRTIGEPPLPYAYTLIPEDWNTRSVVVRFDRPERASPAAVGRVIHSLDPHLAISTLTTLAEFTGSSLMLPRLSALLFGIFGLLGLLLAAVGLYGVLAYAVSQRTHELGIRMAMGARRADILRLVVREGLRLTLLGAVLGLAAALASARVLSAMLYGVGPTDLPTLLAVITLLTLVAAVASLVPARRATRVEPMAVLRHE